MGLLRMRPLKLAFAVLIGLVAVVAILSGFVVVAAVGAVALLVLWLSRLLTGKPAFPVRFQRMPARPAPGASPRPFRADDAIDVETTAVKDPPKSIGP